MPNTTLLYCCFELARNKLSYIAKLLNQKKQSNNVTIQQFNKGFTLIELLIVITILGILASLTLVSYGGTQERARDSKRKQELDNLKKALELARQDTPGAYYYPGCNGNPSCGASQTSPALTPYINPVPKDPRTDADYTYEAINCTGPSDCRSYSLIACLENNKDTQQDDTQNESACPGIPVSYTLTPN